MSVQDLIKEAAMDLFTGPYRSVESIERKLEELAEKIEKEIKEQKKENK